MFSFLEDEIHGSEESDREAIADGYVVDLAVEAANAVRMDRSPSRRSGRRSSDDVGKGRGRGRGRHTKSPKLKKKRRNGRLNPSGYQMRILAPYVKGLERLLFFPKIMPL